MILATLAAIGAMVIAALVLTIADLYLVGHGYQPIDREVLSIPDAGVSMGLADILLLLTAISTWCVIWRLQRRRG